MDLRSDVLVELLGLHRGGVLGHGCCTGLRRKSCGGGGQTEGRGRRGMAGPGSGVRDREGWRQARREREQGYEAAPTFFLCAGDLIHALATCLCAWGGAECRIGKKAKE